MQPDPIIPAPARPLARLARRAKNWQNGLLRGLAVMPVVFGGCDSSTDVPGGSRSLEIVSGADQVAGAGATLSNLVVVRVLTDGQPVADEIVSWRVIEGGGTVAERTSRTDANGIASVVWHLGESIGQQLLLATAGNGSITIRAQGVFQYADVTVGYRHACILSSQGEAFCWGANNSYQLGDGTNTARATPVRVATGLRFRKLSAGWSHTCGITKAGAPFCWGDNAVGQLGQPLGVSASGVPVAVADAPAMNDIAAGFVHSCGVSTDGVVKCWGQDALGQLGGGARIDRHLRVSAGEFHSCGVRDDNVAVCWGSNRNGQTGTNSQLGAIVPPTSTWFGTFSDVSAGLRHSCGVHTNKQVWCWGGSGAGENGQDPGIQIGVPAAVAGTQNYTAVTTGNVHSCGISNGRAFCWGIGHGKTPVQISATLTFTKIDAGYDRTCGLADGSVWCWDAGSFTLTKIAEP